MKHTIIVLLGAVLMVMAQPKHELRFEDMWRMQRVGDAALSPDGNTLVFSATSYSLEMNKGNSDIFIVGADGKGLRAIVQSEKNESAPRFTPDGKRIAYLSGGQVFTCNPDGSEPKALTSFAGGVNDYVLSHDGKSILFTSSVYPDCMTEECNKQRDAEKESSPVKASLFTELMYRHWNDWRGEKRSHLFYMELAAGKAIDIMPGSQSDVPPIALGGASDFAFSPDDKEIAFTMNPDKFIATSTNNEVYILPVSGIRENSTVQPQKISAGAGNDNQPVYSPDGRYLAFCSMERAGFEADKLRLMLYDRKAGTVKNISGKFDRSVGEMIWSNDSRFMYFESANEIYGSVFRIDISNGKTELVFKEHMNSNLLLSPDNTKLYLKQQRTNLPYELFSLDLQSKALKQLTNVNGKYLAEIEMNAVETFWSKGADGVPVQSVMLKPPFFDASRKYPMIFLIHGGPQGHWSDDFHYRWNLQMFAAAGYVVVAPNPRGSTGYGQKFTDGISGDWGGKAYSDLMNAYDYAVKNFSFIDGKNTFAAGASYGGYMINWIAGHTNRFNALVSHAGVFNLESMYGTTEELWFTEWEMKGTPWTNRKLYEKFSPHRYIQNCKTPVLVVHGAYDFRVPEEQAFQLFTSLQRLGVESKFLYFPDETHFVSKPQNAKLWWKTVFNWFAGHYKK